MVNIGSSNDSTDLESDSEVLNSMMTAQAQIPKIPAFDPKELSFDLYESLITAHFATYAITDETKKKNLLLVSIGTKIFATLANLTAPQMPTELSYQDLIAALKRHFVTKPTYHRSLVMFQQRRKKKDETLKELCHRATDVPRKLTEYPRIIDLISATDKGGPSKIRLISAPDIT